MHQGWGRANSVSPALNFLIYPSSTDLAMPPLDEGETLTSGRPLQALARQWQPGLADEDKLTREALHTLLLALHDALMFSMSARWTAMGVANLQHQRKLLMAQCFLRGQPVDKRSLHDGMCARCAALLHGGLGQSSAPQQKAPGPTNGCSGGTPAASRRRSRHKGSAAIPQDV